MKSPPFISPGILDAPQVVGSGLLACGFRASVHLLTQSTCIYAAGVSNSGCTDSVEFDRERERLEHALTVYATADPFVYFGTCSVTDPDMQDSPYVRHKRAMEMRVEAHSAPLVFRLPLVVGPTSNPHTLLNFLYTRIRDGERFVVWRNAWRNVIDIDDVTVIAGMFINDSSARDVKVDIAAPVSYSVIEIIQIMERVVGRPAMYDIVEKGGTYPIDLHGMDKAARQAGVVFGHDYLERVIRKYYEPAK